MRVFLTGATGLLGSHLARELTAHHHHVVALVRRDSDTSPLDGLDYTRVEGDIRDAPDVLAEAMEGCTHAVHGAALVYSNGEWPKIRAINVDGTRNVLTAAVRSSVEHVLHVSSVAVYGIVLGPIDETAPIDGDIPPGDLYARSKREAEGVARGIEQKRGLPVTIVRPSAVYGEHDRLMAPAVAGFLRLPVVPLLGRGDNALPVVYAGNVAVGMRLILEAGMRGTFDIGMDHPLTQRELFEMLAVGMGVRPRFVSLPAGVVRRGAMALSRLGFKTPGAAHLPLDRIVRLALGENPYLSRTIRQRLGFDPPYDHEAALERTGRWLAEERRRTPPPRTSDPR